MSPTIFTSVTRKAASAFTSSTSNPSAGTPLAVVLGVDLSVADLELYDSLGYIVPLGNYGATVSVTSDTNKFFSGTGHLGLTLSSSGIFGGQISTAS
jgi:hypothetical protein